MAAAVAATTVEPAATAAMETIASVEAVAVATTSMPAVVTIATMTVIAAVTIVAMAVVPVSIIATTVEATTVVAVEPGAGADEDTAREVVRSVVAVWRAGVRIVAVVTIGADRRWSNDGTHPDSHANLGVGAARSKKQNSQESNIF
jgi:hypothetical protein